MAGLLVTAGCPEVLGVMPVKKARRTRDVSIGSYREPPPSFYGERISRRFPVMKVIPESCSRLRKSDGTRGQSMRFSTELFFFVGSVSSPARASGGIKTPASI
jgi:hypothetical protein